MLGVKMQQLLGRSLWSKGQVSLWRSFQGSNQKVWEDSGYELGPPIGYTRGGRIEGRKATETQIFKIKSAIYMCCCSSTAGISLMISSALHALGMLR